MSKFSIIVPVYNVEKYLKNCLESILNQSYEDFEVIVVNDGTKDNSQDIIDEFVKKDNRFKGFKKKNEGIATTRNYGINKASGEYIVFVDSDDDVCENLLETIDEIIETDKPDIVRFNAATIDQDSKNVIEQEEFSNLCGLEAFKSLMKNDLFVALWSYAFKRDYWLKNNFKFTDGLVHEDYGLTPYVILKASKVSCTNKVLYNYYVREKSIMNDKELEKLKKKAFDALQLFDENIVRINEDKKVSKEEEAIFKSYMANGLITKCSSLDGDLFDEYFLELKKRNLSQYLLSNTFGRKIKKLVYKLMPKYYIKHF